MASSVQTIGAAAEVLGAGDGSRELLIIQNPSGSGGSIRIGGDDIDASTGILVAAGDPPITFSNGDRDSLGTMRWYACRVTGDVDINVVERGRE